MGKVVLITTKEEPTWATWSELRARNNRHKERITMTQTEARAILEEVVGAGTVEDAHTVVMSRLPNRKAFTYWIGQIGRKALVRLGKGKTFSSYVTAVMKDLRDSRQDEEALLGKKEKKNMEKRDQSTGIISLDMTKAQTPPWPQIPGFDLDNISLQQQHTIRRMVILCDCSVQRSPEGVFDVLARNFPDVGELRWWLIKIGKPHLAELIKRKDLVDAVRKAAHELHKELESVIGKPLARW